MADLVDTIRKEIGARLSESRPVAQEAAGLEAALEALQGTEGEAVARRPQRRARRRMASSGDGRGRSRGQSGEQVIEYVRAYPGSTAGEVATALGRKRNSVSTQLTELAKAGALAKPDRGYSGP